MAEKYSILPWNFEAFRSFISYEVLQQAASVLCIYEGKDIFNSAHIMEKFEAELTLRTGVEWLPKRNINNDINFNSEGNLFRNKARVFTSFYLIDLKSIIDKETLSITPFCRALGTGIIDKRMFYKEIISRFEYPHPAYEESWDKWNEFKISIKPFIFMLDILVNLYNIESNESYFTVSEFATYAHANPIYSESKKIAKDILLSRSNEVKNKRERSDDVDRKIGDLVGFLCMTGYTYFNGNRIYLNLIDVHPLEKVYFYEKRGDVNTKEQIIKIINDGKK